MTDRRRRPSWPFRRKTAPGNSRGRLNAVKRLERLDLTQIAAKKIPSALAEAVAERHAVGTRTLVVVNTVARAQGVTRALQRLLARAEPRPTVALVHSRFRPPERREAMDAAMAEPDPLAGTIVVATQVVEAGIDLSSRLLITEPAPFSSIVQRLGRCNRAGEHDEGTVAWLDTGPLPGGTRPAVKAAAPYRPADLEAARQALLAREGESLSPSAVEGLEVPETAADPAVLRRRDLLDLFDTSPDYVGWWEDPRMRPPTPTRWSGSC